MGCSDTIIDSPENYGLLLGIAGPIHSSFFFLGGGGGGGGKGGRGERGNLRNFNYR